MIRSPIGLRLESEPGRSLREQLIEAARLGAKGVILDAAGDLAPHRLGETGRRDLRNTLQTIEVALVALHLPTRRGFDTEDDLDDRLSRAEKAFAMAYELGSRLVLARLGSVPPASETEPGPRAVFDLATRELALRADRQGVRLGIELHDDPPAELKALLEATVVPSLGASVDPVPLLADGQDPASAVIALGSHVVHVYAPQAGPRSSNRERVGSGRSPSRATQTLDWEAFLGALEEIDYRGFLTIWPDRPADTATQIKAIAKTVERF